uniref:Imidazole glycerol phosphate synthase subunit HisH n=1 Tax=Candidatus Berkiella aquae TaxID=295108 RepID=A0A0Q9YMC4_9GAMM
MIVNNVGTNVASLQYACERLGKEVMLSSDPKLIKSAAYILLPGVSTASRAMMQLKQARLVDTIRSLTQPVLGICSGMQILFDWSEEGNVSGLGLFNEKVRKIEMSNGFYLPHMGWNNIHILNKNCALLNGVADQSDVYYVHSFAAPVNADTVASTKHSELFSAVVAKDNFFGTQFHPERSGAVGSKILANFLAM